MSLWLKSVLGNVEVGLVVHDRDIHFYPIYYQIRKYEIKHKQIMIRATHTVTVFIFNARCSHYSLGFSVYWSPRYLGVLPKVRFSAPELGHSSSSLWYLLSIFIITFNLSFYELVVGLETFTLQSFLPRGGHSRIQPFMVRLRMLHKVLCHLVCINFDGRFIKQFLAPWQRV